MGGFRQTGVDYVRPERMFGVTTNKLAQEPGMGAQGYLFIQLCAAGADDLSGGLLTAVSFIAIIWVIIAAIFIDHTIPRGIPSIIVLVLFFGGINMLSIAILVSIRPKYSRRASGGLKFIC
jgi:dolichol-phosphate mannosyltransferase